MLSTAFGFFYAAPIRNDASNHVVVNMPEDKEESETVSSRKDSTDPESPRESVGDGSDSESSDGGIVIKFKEFGEDKTSRLTLSVNQYVESAFNFKCQVHC